MMAHFGGFLVVFRFCEDRPLLQNHCLVPRIAGFWRENKNADYGCGDRCTFGSLDQ